MKHALAIALALASVTACKKKPSPEATKGSAEPMAAASDAAVAVAIDAAAAWDGQSPLSLDGFATPESVLHDADSDSYLVSNINGKPHDADDNGFISKLAPDGTITALKWIDGSKDTVKLDAPKGMAIVDGTLYVADITVVRKFDAKTGEPKGEIKVVGATFLNDVTPSLDGGVYVTDSGLTPDFTSNGSDAVYQIAKDDKVHVVHKNKSLSGPNGIFATKDYIWVVTFGSGEIYQLGPKGVAQPQQALPKGKNDGVVALEGGELLVSSWDGSAIYRGKPGGEWKPVVENVQSPADIGWDAKRKRILIPLFMGNKVILHPLGA